MNSMNKYTQNLRRRVRTQQRHIKTDRPYLVCGDCKHTVAETCFVAHVQKEHPNKRVRCAKCKQIIPLEDFIQHFNSCKGMTIPE